MDATSFETERLRLRSWRASDFDAAQRLFRDPEVMRYIPIPPIDTEEKARELFERIRAREPATGMCLWVVEDKLTGAVLGDCGLKPLDEGEEIEVGYHFFPEHWGLGYATEAARGALEHGFERLGLDRIVAVVLPENVASTRVLEKAGMRRAGERKAYGANTVFFELTAREWKDATG